MSYSLKIKEESNDHWIIMVHGMSQNHSYFENQVKYFRKNFNILLIDLPGHGAAAELNGPFGHIEMAKHVANEVCKQQILNACYWGTHTGATIAPLVIEKCSHQIKSAILEAPCVPGENPHVVVENVERAKTIARTNSVQDAIDIWWRKSPWFETIRNFPIRCRAKRHRAIIDQFSGKPWLFERPALPVKHPEKSVHAMRVPTLVYNGETDHMEFRAAADQMANLMHLAERLLVPGCGGFPAWEAPAYINSLAADFLSER